MKKCAGQESNLQCPQAAVLQTVRLADAQPTQMITGPLILGADFTNQRQRSIAWSNNGVVLTAPPCRTQNHKRQLRRIAIAHF